MTALQDVLDRLRRSTFRSRFGLSVSERKYAEKRGIDLIRAHALGFVTQRLAPASLIKDGKQTSMKGHPVFVAQHATATCCRKCLQKWHGFSRGRALSDPEIEYVVAVIMAWIENQVEGKWGAEKKDQAGTGRQLSLFEREESQWDNNQRKSR